MYYYFHFNKIHVRKKLKFISFFFGETKKSWVLAEKLRGFFAKNETRRETGKEMEARKRSETESTGTKRSAPFTAAHGREIR